MELPPNAVLEMSHSRKSENAFLRLLFQHGLRDHLKILVTRAMGSWKQTSGSPSSLCFCPLFFRNSGQHQHPTSNFTLICWLISRISLHAPIFSVPTRQRMRLPMHIWYTTFNIENLQGSYFQMWVRSRTTTMQCTMANYSNSGDHL